MTERINIRGIIFQNGKMFVQQLKPDHNGIERDFWCTPGGGLDKGESLVAGLTREMIEETGVMPDIGKLLFIQQFTDESGSQLEFFFHIKNADNYETIDLSSTSHGELEIKDFGFVDVKTHNVLPAFLQTIDIQDYITNNKPVYIYSEL